MLSESDSATEPTTVVDIDNKPSDGAGTEMVLSAPSDGAETEIASALERQPTLSMDDVQRVADDAGGSLLVACGLEECSLEVIALLGTPEGAAEREQPGARTALHVMCMNDALERGDPLPELIRAVHALNPDAATARDELQNTPFAALCWNRNATPAVLELVAKLSGPDALRGASGVGVPLHVMCRHNPAVTPEMVRALHELDPLAVRGRHASGATPLHFICANVHARADIVLQVYALFPAAVHVEDAKGRSPLDTLSDRCGGLIPEAFAAAVVIDYPELAFRVALSSRYSLLHYACASDESTDRVLAALLLTEAGNGGAASPPGGGGGGESDDGNSLLVMDTRPQLSLGPRAHHPKSQDAAEYERSLQNLRETGGDALSRQRSSMCLPESVSLSLSASPFSLKSLLRLTSQTTKERVASNGLVKSLVFQRISSPVAVALSVFEFQSVVLVIVCFCQVCVAMRRGHRLDDLPVWPYVALTVLPVLFDVGKLAVMVHTMERLGNARGWARDNVAHILVSVWYPGVVAFGAVHKSRDSRAFNLCAAFGCLLMCWKFLVTIKALNVKFARFVLALNIILVEAVPFAIVLSSALIFFGVGFFMLLAPDYDSLHKHEDKHGPFGSVRNALWQMTNFDWLTHTHGAGFDGFERSPDTYLAYALFNAIVVIILLNVLIAIVCDAYEMASARSLPLYLLARLERAVELDAIMYSWLLEPKTRAEHKRAKQLELALKIGAFPLWCAHGARRAAIYVSHGGGMHGSAAADRLDPREMLRLSEGDTESRTEFSEITDSIDALRKDVAEVARATQGLIEALKSANGVPNGGPGPR